MTADEQIRLKAAICSRFGVAWHRYGELTLREQRVLAELLAEEAADQQAEADAIEAYRARLDQR